MHGPRNILIVTPAFWPVIDDRTQRLVSWIESLQAHNSRCTILSNRPNRDWPAKIIFGSTEVHRLLYSPNRRSFLGGYRRTLMEWFKQHCRGFDLVYFDALDGIQLQAVTYAAEQAECTVAIRHQASNLSEPSAAIAQRSAAGPLGRQALLAALQAADVVLVPNAASEQSLRSMGLQHRNLVRTADLGSGLDRSIVARREARRSMAAVNTDLFVRQGESVIVCSSGLDEQSGTEWLARVISPWLVNHPKVRFWLCGDGPALGRIYDQFRHHGIHRQAVLPGIFTDQEVVLQAADVCLLPKLNSAEQWLLPTCERSGIPTISPLPKTHSSEPTNVGTSTQFRDEDAESLLKTLNTWNNQPGAWQREALAKQRQAVDAALVQPSCPLLQLPKTPCTNQP